MNGTLHDDCRNCWLKARTSQTNRALSLPGIHPLNFGNQPQTPVATINPPFFFECNYWGGWEQQCSYNDLRYIPSDVGYLCRFSENPKNEVSNSISVCTVNIPVNNNLTFMRIYYLQCTKLCKSNYNCPVLPDHLLHAWANHRPIQPDILRKPKTVLF